MSAVVKVALLLAVLLQHALHGATQCSLPSSAEINRQLQIFVRSLGAENSDVITNLNDHHFICLALGVQSDTYRFLGILVNYTTSDAGNTVFVSRMALQCGRFGQYDRRGFQSIGNPADSVRLFNIPTRRDCRVCAVGFGFEDSCIRK